MGAVENQRLFAHYTGLTKGCVKSGNPVRDQLIVSDAKRHLADLISKHPELDVKEEPKEEAPKKKKGASDGRE